MTDGRDTMAARRRFRRRRSLRSVAAFSMALALLVIVPAGADEAELAAARAEAQAAADAFVAAENRLLDTEAALQRTEAELQTTRADYERLRSAVAEELIDQYVRAGVGEVPLMSSDFNEQARASALSRAAFGKVRGQADELTATRASLDRQLEQLATQQSAAQRQRDELAGQQDALYERLRELEQIEAERQEAERLAEQARREEEAAAAQAAYEASQQAASSGSDGSGSGAGRGPAPARPVVPVDWLCPITGAYSYSDTWGSARSGGRSHRGTDIFADYGTPVVAVVDGTAVNYGWEDAGGNGVFLLGSDGNRYFYAHLDDFGRLGSVSQGDVVGYVGDTGNAVGTPHLHFEIHPGGSGHTNPYSTLTGYC